MQRDREPGPQERGLRPPPTRQPRPPHRGLPLRLRNGQHELPPRPAVRRLKRLRPQGRHARPRRPQDRVQLRAHRPASVGNERRVLVSELSGRSNIAEKLGEHGLDSDPDPDDPRPRPRPGPGKRGLPVRGRRGLVPPAGRKALRPLPAPASSGSATASTSRTAPTANPSPRPPSSSGSATPSNTPSARGTAPSTPSTAPCARPSPPTSPASPSMHLVDYKVRVINVRAGTAARVRVVIESQDDHAVWGTDRRLRKRHRSLLARPRRRLRTQNRPRRPRLDRARPCNRVHILKVSRGKSIRWTGRTGGSGNSN